MSVCSETVSLRLDWFTPVEGRQRAAVSGRGGAPLPLTDGTATDLSAHGGSGLTSRIIRASFVSFYPSVSERVREEIRERRGGKGKAEDARETAGSAGHSGGRAAAAAKKAAPAADAAALTRSKLNHFLQLDVCLPCRLHHGMDQGGLTPGES